MSDLSWKSDYVTDVWHNYMTSIRNDIIAQNNCEEGPTFKIWWRGRIECFSDSGERQDTVPLLAR